MTRRAGPEAEYQFSFSLRRAKRIRRSVVMRGSHTLDDLHHVIFHAFDRFGEHLYCFYIRTSRTNRLAGIDADSAGDIRLQPTAARAIMSRRG